MAGKLKREDCSVSTEGWSRWVRAIVPPDGVKNKEDYEKRDDHFGYMCKNIRTAFDGYNCGMHVLTITDLVIFRAWICPFVFVIFQNCCLFCFVHRDL